MEILMIRSLDALIDRNGNVVRSGIARPETVARYLTQVTNLADYQVVYWLDQRPHRVSGDGFLALYAAGRIPSPQPLTGALQQWRRSGPPVEAAPDAS
jgi:hypothetical protein